MILTCPACATRFLVEGLTLPAEGRALRCGRCKHVWQQEPLAEDASAPAPADATGASGALPQEPLEMPEWRPRPLPQPTARFRPNLWVPALAASLLVALLAGGLWLFRAEVVALWEPAARLYETLGLPVPVAGEGLMLDKLAVKSYRADGKTVLLVSGQVTNPGKAPRLVPPLFVRDTAKRTLLQWEYPLPETLQQLPGGATVPFYTQQLVDNELATNVLVRIGAAGPAATDPQ
jgi:predicted Zn finger-like uncharacterized protein